MLTFINNVTTKMLNFFCIHFLVFFQVKDRCRNFESSAECRGQLGTEAYTGKSKSILTHIIFVSNFDFQKFDIEQIQSNLHVYMYFKKSIFSRTNTINRLFQTSCKYTEYQ